MNEGNNYSGQLAAKLCLIHADVRALLLKLLRDLGACKKEKRD